MAGSTDNEPEESSVIPQEHSPSDADLLDRIDGFVRREVRPLEAANPELFDHRSEQERTDHGRGGLPSQRWLELLAEARRRADRAGLLRLALPPALGGEDAPPSVLAAVRDHLASSGPGLHDDPASRTSTEEASIVGIFRLARTLHAFATTDARERWVPGIVDGTERVSFALTEPGHGSDALHLESVGRASGADWVVSGHKRFVSGAFHATAALVFARTSGMPGDRDGLTAFLIPTGAAGVDLSAPWTTHLLPTWVSDVRLDAVHVGPDAVVGEVGGATDVAQHLAHEVRLHHAATDVGTASFCLGLAAGYAAGRTAFGRPIADNQGILFPLARLASRVETTRAFIRSVCADLDRGNRGDLERDSAIAKLESTAVAGEAVDLAIQVLGGLGYTAHVPLSQIAKEQRLRRIADTSDELLLQRIGEDLVARVDPTAAGLMAAATVGPPFDRDRREGSR
jgi:alkylation response protein AidB-like acyl-CoA dehydrogenase